MATPQQILDTAVNWAVKAPSARSADEILASIRQLRDVRPAQLAIMELRDVAPVAGVEQVPIALQPGEE